MQGSASTHWNKTEVVIFECHLTQNIGIPGSCHSCLTHLLICYTTLTSSEARYTHRCATSSAVHILPVFCLAMKSLYAWGVAEGHKWVPLQGYRHSVFCLFVLLLFLTKKKKFRSIVPKDLVGWVEFLIPVLGQVGPGFCPSVMECQQYLENQNKCIFSNTI